MVLVRTGVVMDCIVCGQDAGYHRIVVDTLEDTRVGGFCRECERSEFGRSLERGRFTETEGCILCARDALYALPVGQPTATRNEDESVVGDVVYDTVPETPRLCDEHFHELAEADPEPGDGRVRREFW